MGRFVKETKYRDRFKIYKLYMPTLIYRICKINEINYLKNKENTN